MARRVLLYAPLLVYTLLLLFLLLSVTFGVPIDPNATSMPGEEVPCKSSMDVVNGTARLTLCMQGRNVWKERRNNDRTTQVFATILNAGDSQVCDLHVEVSNMENAIRWWPTWFNTTVYPYFTLLPGQTVSVGAVIPQAKGFPQIKITQMRPCDGESPPLDEEDDIDMTNEGEGPPPSDSIDLARNATTATITTTKPAATSGLTINPTVLTTPTDSTIPAKHISVEVNKAEGEPTGATTASAMPADLATAADSTAVAPATVPAPKADAPEDEAVEGEEENEQEEIPSALKGKKKCEVVKGVNGLQARWCVDLSPKVWVEPRRKKRYVRVAGEVTNIMSNVSLCNIEIWLQSNKSAVSTWPEWWPNSSDEQLDPGNSFMVGANVYFKRGKPQIKLLSFDECVDTGALPEDPPASVPTGGYGGGGADFGGDVGGGPAPSPWQSPTQSQGQEQRQGQQQDGGQQWTAPTPVPKPTTVDLGEAYNNNSSNDNNNEDHSNNANNNNNNNNDWNNGGGGDGERGDGGGRGDGGSQWHV